MKKEFNLSDKIMYQMGDEEFTADEVITIDDIREFIKILKEQLFISDAVNDEVPVWEIIDKLAGEKLNGTVSKEGAKGK